MQNSPYLLLQPITKLNGTTIGSWCLITSCNPLIPLSLIANIIVAAWCALFIFICDQKLKIKGSVILCCCNDNLATL